MMCDYSRLAHRAFRHGFGFMAGAGRFFGPGEVRLALLSLLADEPMHGYQLMRRLEERSGGIYRASAGTVYPTLQQLEDEGLIISELQDSKKVYKLTDAGRRELADRDETVQQIWRRARRWEDWRAAFDPDAAEIRGPAERLVKAAFRAAAGEQAAQRIERVPKSCSARCANSRNSLAPVHAEAVSALPRARPSKSFLFKRPALWRA